MLEHRVEGARHVFLVLFVLMITGGFACVCGCGNDEGAEPHAPVTDSTSSVAGRPTSASAKRGTPKEAAQRREVGSPSRSGGEPQYLPRIAIALGARRLEVELARTPEQRARGLMFRTDLGPDDGMLFAFPRPQPLSFWMRNTPTALSIAFIDHDGRIVRIARMRPFDERSVESGVPAQFALEMPAGYFARHGIRVGDRLRLLDPLPPVE